MKQLLLAFAIWLAPCTLTAEAYVMPVATARGRDRVYSTTTAFQNKGPLDIACEAIYAVTADPDGATLRAKYDIPAGETLVEHDTLMEAGAVGTMRILCSGPATIVARVRTSVDDGLTFDEGRIYPAVSEDTRIASATTIQTSTDLLVMEIAGRRTPFDITVRDQRGVTVGAKQYELPPFSQQIINLATILPEAQNVTVDFKVAPSAGDLVISRPTRDATLLTLTARPPLLESGTVDPRHAQKAALPSITVATSPAVQDILVAAFKASPLQDPLTGLIYMRDRWYDPSTGSFLTPDPEGNTDSPNLYAYCGGDPVNCSDPTGRAASVSRSGVIIGKRPDGRAYRFGAGYGRRGTQERMQVQLALEMDADLTRSEVRDIMERAGLQYGPTTTNCVPVDTCIRAAAPKRAGDYVVGSALQVSNTVNALLAPINVVNGQRPFPTPDPQNDRERAAYELTGDVLSTVLMTSAVAALVPSGALTGQVVGGTYNISTVSMSEAERLAVLEYARRTNVWLESAGAQVVHPTKGPLRRAASAAARRERLRAERSGDAYTGQVGHVPDTAISNQAEPPAGWLDMPGTSNQCCGGGLGTRIGQPIRIITVDGKVPR